MPEQFPPYQQPNQPPNPYQSPLLGDVTNSPYQSPGRALNNERITTDQFGRKFHPRYWSIGRLIFFGLGLVIILAIGTGIFIFGNLQGKSLFPQTGSATITYWGIDQPESAIQPLIDQYQDSHPNVKIKYELRTTTQYRQTLQTRISQGTGPDIFRFHNTWLPLLKDSLEPVPANIYSSTDFQNLFYPVVRQNLSLSGQMYGIPLEYDGLALIYNPDILNAAGLPNAPTTWSDILEVYGPKITKFNSDGTVSVGTAALGTSTNIDYFSDILGAMMLQNGVKMVGSDGHVAIDTTKVTGFGGAERNLGSDVLSFYTILAKGFNNNPRPVWDNTLPSAIQSFAAGRVAMIIVPNRALPDIQNAINQNRSGVKIAVAPLPQILPANESSPVYWASYWAEGVSKTSSNKAAAWDFLKFLSSKESEIELYNEETKARGFGEIPARTDLADQFKSNPLTAGFINGASKAKSWYLAANTGDAVLNDKLITIFGTAVTSVLQQNVTPDNAIKTAANDAAAVLSQFQLSLPSTSPNANR